MQFIEIVVVHLHWNKASTYVSYSKKYNPSNQHPIITKLPIKILLATDKLCNLRQTLLTSKEFYSDRREVQAKCISASISSFPFKCASCIFLCYCNNYFKSACTINKIQWPKGPSVNYFVVNIKSAFTIAINVAITPVMAECLFIFWSNTLLMNCYCLTLKSK